MEYVRLSNIKLEENIGNRVYVVFMASGIEVKTQKDNVTKYIDFNMVDKEVTVRTKLFNATQRHIDMIKSGFVYQAAVDIKKYEKSATGFSCIIYNIEQCSIDSSIFINWDVNINDNVNFIAGKIQNLTEPYRSIAYNLLNREWRKFTTWTAAKSMHHTQLGGLLAHTVEVTNIAISIADYMCKLHGEKFIDKNLLIAACILHDYGKITELNVAVTTGLSEYSTEAVLQSHIMGVLGDIEKITVELGIGKQTNTNKDIKTIEAEKEKIMLLKHCVASHHGKLEWGSPIMPNIPEAVILSHADKIDSELFRFADNFKNMKAGESHSIWANGEMISIYKDSSKV